MLSDLKLNSPPGQQQPGQQQPGQQQPGQQQTAVHQTAVQEKTAEGLQDRHPRTCSAKGSVLVMNKCLRRILDGYTNRSRFVSRKHRREVLRRNITRQCVSVRGIGFATQFKSTGRRCGTNSLRTGNPYTYRKRWDRSGVISINRCSGIRVGIRLSL